MIDFDDMNYKVYSGTLDDSEDTLVTVGAGKTFILKGFWISNSAGYALIAELTIDGARLLPEVLIPAHDTLISENLHFPIESGKTIKAKGQDDSSLDYYLWGIEEG